jgi:hypothetical protein
MSQGGNRPDWCANFPKKFQRLEEPPAVPIEKSIRHGDRLATHGTGRLISTRVDTGHEDPRGR